MLTQNTPVARDAGSPLPLALRFEANREGSGRVVAVPDVSCATPGGSGSLVPGSLDAERADGDHQATVGQGRPADRSPGGHREVGRGRYRVGPEFPPGGSHRVDQQDHQAVVESPAGEFGPERIDDGRAVGRRLAVPSVGDGVGGREHPLDRPSVVRQDPIADRADVDLARVRHVTGYRIHGQKRSEFWR